jgi:hypothetical protein
VATVEYAALAVLVSLAVVVGGAAADAPAIGAAVGGQLRRAYCVVAGGDCFARGGPRPCVVRSDSKLAENRVSLALVRLRDGRTVLLEELSDGSFRVSLTLSSGGGAGIELGADVRILGRTVRAGVDAEAGGDIGYGQTFVVADAAAARRLVERLEADGPPVGGAVPRLVEFLRGRGDDGEAERTAVVSTRAEAQAALEALGLGPRAGVLRGITGSVRLDRRTGDRTIGLRLGGELLGSLGAALAQASAGAVSSAGAELVLDRDRRPRELVVRGVGGVHGEARMLSGGVAAGDLREIQARVDLTDPQVRALADRLLGGDLGAVRAFGEHLAREARIDVRHFALTRDQDSFGGRAGGVGVQHHRLRETARLVAAEGRETGLGWSRRLDCVLAT